MPEEPMRAGPSHASGTGPLEQRDSQSTNHNVNTEVNGVLTKTRGRPKKQQRKTQEAPER
jgi:hypothetical protein